jgi:stage II sporulation protein AA (anti-sigma F factor antagonist)
MDDDGFRLDVQPTSSHIVVHLSGELDSSIAHVVRGQLTDLIVQGDERDVLLDFQNLQFIDASGLGILVSTNASLGADGRRLQIQNPSEFVMRLFRITGLDRSLGLPEI